MGEYLWVTDGFPRSKGDARLVFLTASPRQWPVTWARVLFAMLLVKEKNKATQCSEAIWQTQIDSILKGNKQSWVLSCVKSSGWPSASQVQHHVTDSFSGSFTATPPLADAAEITGLEVFPSQVSLFNHTSCVRCELSPSPTPSR